MTAIATKPLPENPLLRLIAWIIDWLEAVPYSFIALIARLSISGVFWMSGQTKVDGWHLKPSTFVLFQNDYRLPFLDPTIAAYASAIAEHLFPVLLVLGLASRFSALSLLIMTTIIEIFVYPDAWPTHGTWATCFLLILCRGPGVISLDHFIARAFGMERRPKL